MPDYKLIVIGGGAAGFFGAITAAEHGVDGILILEKTREVLTKVRISGGGRCNVTHDCPEPRELIKNYPRGHKSLHGPFSRFHATDTIAWFTDHGVTLVTESDGRMFPDTNTSETIVNCLMEAARGHGIEWRLRAGVVGLEAVGSHYAVHTSDGSILTARSVLVATGGLRNAESRLAARESGLGHSEPVASLFTFKIDDPRLTGLAGSSCPFATIKAGGLTSSGPLLVTHWGLSGPAVLKLSAWGARELAEADYRFPITINWTGSLSSGEIRERLVEERASHPTRTIQKRSLVTGLPQRIWARLCEAAAITEEATWANLTKGQLEALIGQLGAARFEVAGKSTNKDEFVTCGGINLKELDLKTMEARTSPGLHFAGEVLDIDGVTGGFNFQAAWTTGRLAGMAIAARFDPQES